MQIIAFLLLILVIMLLLSAKKESVGPRIKLTIAGAFVLLTVMALIYEGQFAKKQDTNRVMLNHFDQGGILECNSKKVDNTHYNYEHGTQAFVAKREYTKLSGVVISLSDCEVASR